MYHPCPRTKNNFYWKKSREMLIFNDFLFSKEGKRGAMGSKRVTFGQVHFYKAD